MLSKEAKVTFPLSSSSICSKTQQGDMRAWMQRENYPLRIPSMKDFSSKMRRTLNVNICRPSQSFLFWMMYKKTTKYISMLQTVKKKKPSPLSHLRSKVCLNRAVVKALWNARRVRHESYYRGTGLPWARQLLIYVTIVVALFIRVCRARLCIFIWQ